VSAGSKRTAIIVLAAALVVSLCLNMFVAGAWFAGRYVDRSLAAAANAAMSAYPPSLRRAVRQKLVAERQELRAAVTDLREARLRMFAAMRADPLDRGALDRSMAEVRVKTTNLQALLQTAFAEVLEQAPLSERQKIESPRLGANLFLKRQN
jgi:uncharacterized membrane protein